MKSFWVQYDQLSTETSVLRDASPGEGVVLLIESKAQATRMRYHRHRLVLIFSAMRHFAQSLESKGWQVDYHSFDETPDTWSALQKHSENFKPESIHTAAPSNWHFEQALEKWCRKLSLPIKVVPDAHFLVSREEFRKWAGSKRHLLMESHYRRMRKKHDLLMEPNGGPKGGEWNYDSDNRKTFEEWKRAGCPKPARSPQARPDSLTRRVMREVDEAFPDHPGQAESFWLPVDREGSLRWLHSFLERRFEEFGPYEDLMVENEPVLFHSVLSPMLNLGLLTPADCVDRAVEAYREGRIPISSAEGFIRQIIGWREFINGVYWLKMPGYEEVNELRAVRPLPDWFYTGETDLHCLRQCLRQVLDTGFNHHIQRLMVLGNFFLLTGIRPREVLRWYSEMYVDAHDWVMAANVLGMVLHADGGFMSTKPYAAGSGYISKMSNYCQNCRYDPKIKTGPDACPFNYLYWNFYDRHQDRFSANPRTSLMIKNWIKRSESARQEVRESASEFLKRHVPGPKGNDS